MFRKIWIFIWPLLLTIGISMIFISLVNFNIHDYRINTPLFFVFYFLFSIFFLTLNRYDTKKAIFYLAMPLFLFTIEGLIANPALFPTYIPAVPLAGLAGIIVVFMYKKASKSSAFFFGTCSIIVLLLYCFWLLPKYIQTQEKNALKFLEQKPVNFTNSLQKLDKTNVTYQMLSQRKVVLLDFWFIGCDPCMRKMKYLQELHNAYKLNPNVLIAVVSFGGSDTIEEVLAFKQKHPEYTFEFLYDVGGEFSKKNNFTGYPVELILNSSQNVISTYHGFRRETEHLYFDKTKQTIETILNDYKLFK